MVHWPELIEFTIAYTEVLIALAVLFFNIGKRK